MNARPAVPAAGELEREHPAAGRAAGGAATSRWGWLGERRVVDAGHAGLTLQPRARVPPPSPSGGPSGSRASRGRAARGTPRCGASVAPVSTWTLRIASISSRRPLTTPARTSLWPARYFVADSIDEVRAELDRPAEIRRRERVVDDVARAVAVGQLGERGVVGDDDRRVGDRLRVEDAGRARPPGAARPRRDR